MRNLIWILIFVSIIISCKKSQPNIDSNTNQSITQKQPQKHLLQHATSFELDSTAQYLVYSYGKGKKNQIQISHKNLPFQNIIVTSASAVAYLDALDKTNLIKGVYDAKWIYSKRLHQQIIDGYTKDLRNSNGMDLEKIIALQPDAIITFSDPNKVSMFEILIQNGIEVIYLDEYLEETPLGKAEYIKLFGYLTGEKAKADIVFDEVNKNYSALKQKVKKLDTKPTVFADIMRGDIWYQPGGHSFAAQFFEDAGANYLWKDNQSTQSINLDFETVYQKAGKADFWLNASDFTSLEQLDNAFKNHYWFQAYQKGKVYAYSKRVNDKGANDYFETGTVRPDIILQDLIKIFHPEILPEHSLYFYKQLE